MDGREGREASFPSFGAMAWPLREDERACFMAKSIGRGRMACKLFSLLNRFILPLYFSLSFALGIGLALHPNSNQEPQLRKRASHVHQEVYNLYPTKRMEY